MKWIVAVETAPARRRSLTRRWAILTKDGAVTLGNVAWFPAWRRYTFYPNLSTIYEADCLRDLADFCSEQTLLRREERAAEKAKS